MRSHRDSYVCFDVLFMFYVDFTDVNYTKRCVFFFFLNTQDVNRLTKTRPFLTDQTLIPNCGDVNIFKVWFLHFRTTILLYQ